MTTLPVEYDRVDPSDLHDHLRRCACASGRLHRLRCAVEALDAFIAPRFVTSVAVLAVFLMAGLLLPA